MKHSTLRITEQSLPGREFPAAATLPDNITAAR